MNFNTANRSYRDQIAWIPGFYRGTYSLKITAGGGIRMWIANQLVIDNWGSAPSGSLSANITLQATAARPQIRLEYRHLNGPDFISLTPSSSGVQLVCFPPTAPEPGSSGQDLLQTLPYDSSLDINGYAGWTPQPSAYQNCKQATSQTGCWQVETNVQLYRKDLSPDIDAKFAGTPSLGKASLTRDLGTVSDLGPGWKLAATVAFGIGVGSGNKDGVALDIVDEIGQIISRIQVYVESAASGSDNRLYGVWGNGQLLYQESDPAAFQSTVMSRQPLTITALKSGSVRIQYGSNSAVTVKPFDLTSHWQRPTAFQVLLSSTNAVQYEADISALTFFATAP